MTGSNTITFYDLQVSTGATISPFVWATKFAVAHKQLEMDVIEGGFTGILERTGGKTERLPAIVDGGNAATPRNVAIHNASTTGFQPSPTRSLHTDCTPPRVSS